MRQVGLPGWEPWDSYTRGSVVPILASGGSCHCGTNIAVLTVAAVRRRRCVYSSASRKFDAKHARTDLDPRFQVLALPHFKDAVRDLHQVEFSFSARRKQQASRFDAENLCQAPKCF